MLCYVMLCYVMLCCVMLCYVMLLCYAATMLCMQRGELLAMNKGNKIRTNTNKAKIHF